MSAQNISEPLSPPPAPGVMSSYNHGWTKLWKNFPNLLLAGIVYFLIGSLIDLPDWWTFINGDWRALTNSNPGQDLLGLIYSFLVTTPLLYGLSFVYLKAVRGNSISTGDLFEGFKNYGNAVLSALLTMLIIIAGFILLIIPGFIFAIKLAFVPYLVVDQKLNAVDAIKESWRMTGGHSWTIFGIYLMAIPVALLGLLILIIGIIPAMMLAMMAEAAIYYAISSRQPKTDSAIIDAASPVA